MSNSNQNKLNQTKSVRLSKSVRPSKSMRPSKAIRPSKSVRPSKAIRPSDANQQGNYKYVFYPDLHKKYKQFANKNGEGLLEKLSKKVNAIIGVLLVEMEKQKLDPKTQLQEGFNIYDKKPSQHKGITWSDEEYQHLGFQSIYIKTKSIQRFTETYNLLIRAYNQGYLDQYLSKLNGNKKNINIISIGGGPGFELYAIQLFFEKFYPNIKVELTTLDLNDLWKIPNQVFDIKFIQGSFYDLEMIDVIKQHDMSIMSYVIQHYFSRGFSRENKMKKRDLLKSMFDGKMGMMLVNSRVKRIEILDYLKKNGLYVYNLIHKYDNRQTVVSKYDLKKTESVEKKYQIPFLNVPY